MTAGGERRVTVYAKSTAVAATAVKPGKTYPLSVLDHAMARHTVHLVFYFRPGPTMSRDRLKESLSDVLTHYPVMTGRLTRTSPEDGSAGDWVVKCNDAGVRVLDARARATVDEWLATATAGEERELAYWEPMGVDPSIWSPFYIQITEFEDKGYAIGLSCPHMHADPTCAILLIKAWGDAHRRTYITTPPFFHPPALLPRSPPSPSAPILAAKSQPAAAAAASMSSATLKFSDAAVRSILADLHPFNPDATPFSALAALFLSRLPPAPAALCIDFRKRLSAPLPHGFYGNALHFSGVSAGGEWGATAAAVKEKAEGTGEEEYWAAIDWLAARKGEGPFAMYGPELTCMGMDHVMAYQAAFDSRAAHVSCWVGGAVGEGVVAVMPSPEEGAGRAVVVTLPEGVVDGICRDEAILKYGPTIMLAGRV